MPEKNFKFPKTMGTCADNLYKLREDKKEAKKIVDAIETEEKALKLHIINTLPKSNASGISGKVANVAILSKEVPQLADPLKFFKYVAKNNRFDLMQRRLSVGAIADMWEDGKKIPGIEKFIVISVSLTKLK